MNVREGPQDGINFLLEAGSMSAGVMIIILGIFNILHPIMVDALFFNLACTTIFFFRLYRYNKVARVTPGMSVATIHTNELVYGYAGALGGVFWFVFFTIWPGGW